MATAWGDFHATAVRLLIAAGAFAAAACLLAFVSIFKHMANYRRPDLQKCIVRILIMVPVYAIDSFFSLRFQARAARGAGTVSPAPLTGATSG